ncbi:4-aminobutyrate--2-oxoglutarate transaminase [Bogoriella caseilytica]|uniref:(S)-3-amino-2-methylpropionate transaminase n=1 Tax=Bogoriella caseilytica TaxID=56055 RepID=A0A3N2BDI0_9MICO|nr:4-aminobutyrate--2-oxoglutarate transaminase [Bogoriella caseilytica]ROR73309.1 4-aminobutyrate aminotransferase [Bogoriella caseilytica]
MTTTPIAPASTTEQLDARRRTALPTGLASVMDRYMDHGEAEYLVDTEGKRWLDFGSGIAVTSLGHGRPEVTEAITAQAQKLLHTCFLLSPYESYIAVAEALNELTPGDHAKKSAIFSTGAEAVENAVKIARAATGRHAVVVADHAFHGRTNLTMTMTAKNLPYKKSFGPFAPEVYRIPMAYPLRWPGGPEVAADQALQAARDVVMTQVGAENVAAIVVEPIVGEGGFIVPAPGYLAGLRALADEAGAVLVADEIQTGFCRTGAWFASEHEGVVPDLITTAKGIASGMPLAAVTGRAELMDAVHPGGLGGTFAGNPLSCAAALATIEAMRAENLEQRAAAIGAEFTRVLAPLAQELPHVAEVRGRGAMQAVEFVRPEAQNSLEPAPELAKAALEACRAEGLIALTCGTYGNVLRLLPPLTLSDEGLATGLDIIAGALRKVGA